MPATVRRSRLLVAGSSLPADDELKLRFSTVREAHPWSLAYRRIRVIVWRSRASLTESGKPVRTQGNVTGGPTGLPAASTIHAAKWSALKSTARVARVCR